MDTPISERSYIPEDMLITIPCGECDRETRHKVLTETATHREDAGGVVDLWVQHQIVQCQGCLTISFCEASQFSEDMDHDPETEEVFHPTKRKFYPNRITGRAMIREARFLPTNVYRIYEEAHGALCAELRIMAGVAIRAIVEAVCKDKNVVGRNLQTRIDALVAEGSITQSGGQILHSLRFMGNAAAHEMQEHTQLELNTAFHVIEHMLNSVYVLPKQAEELPNRNR